MKMDFRTVSQKCENKDSVFNHCKETILSLHENILLKLVALNCMYWPLTHAKNAYRLAGPVAYKWYPVAATNRMQNCTRVAASRMQNEPRPPRIKSKGISLRLAATRVQFAYDWLPHGREIFYGWPPVAYYFCMRLAATRVQFECDWPPDSPTVLYIQDIQVYTVYTVCSYLFPSSKPGHKIRFLYLGDE